MIVSREQDPTIKETSHTQEEIDSMQKKIGIFIVLSFLLVLVAACSRSGAPTTTANSAANTTMNSASAAGNSADVSLDSTTFSPASVTIAKGGSVNLINGTAMVHIIQNGTWANGAAKSEVESGAPTVNALQFSTVNQKQTVGPFNTAGTFQLYCTVHPGMNLTIIVQ
jgi:plastocyanin